MESKNEYLEAARIIAECKPSKLPYVLAILEQGGFDIKEVSSIVPKLVSEKKKEFLASERSKEPNGLWAKTSNADILNLRSAYQSGLNISKLSSLSGIGRTTIYKFIAAEKPTSETTRVKLMAALHAIQTE